MTYDFLIVGGGIGGAVLANLLGRQGKRVLVLERDIAPVDRVRPEVLWPATVEVLRSLLPASDEESWRLSIRGLVAMRRGATLVEVRPDQLRETGVEPHSTDPTRTRELLLSRAQAEVRRGVEVVGVLKEADRVKGVRCRNVAGRAEQEVLATWTVGDDGVRSRIRQECGISLAARALSLEFLTFPLAWPAAWPAGVVHLFLHRRPRSGILAVGFVPLPRGRGVGLVLARPAVLTDANHFNAALRELCDTNPVTSQVLEGRTFPAGFVRVRPQWGHAASYGAMGAVLIGDAAHPVTPAGGQGANMAVADALVLAELAAGDERRLVGDYEQRRRPANDRSISISRRASRVLSLPAIVLDPLLPWAAQLARRRPRQVVRLFRFISTAFQTQEHDRPKPVAAATRPVAMRKRVLLAGLFHETHTFLPGRTRLDDFSIRRGDELLSAAGDGSPLAGVLEVAESAGWEVLPAIDLRATPSATVEDQVVEHFWTGFRDAARQPLARGVDGIFLVLHGAMVSESHPDVEGEVLSRISTLAGAADVPLCGVVDLHGNFTTRMATGAHALVAYRENPHADAHAAAMHAARLLDRLMHSGQRPVTVWERPPLMWPPTGTGTADDPMRTLEALAREIETARPEILAVNVFAGFSFADTPDTGVSFTAVTLGDEADARRELRRLSEFAIEHRREGNRVDPPLESVLPLIEGVEGPVLLVEPSDNIGGGAPGDGVAILRALVERGFDKAGVIINDPRAVARLADVQLGERLELEIGGRENTWAGGPLRLAVELVLKSDGRFEIEDRHSHLASMSGTRIDMGPSAVVHHRGVTILLTSRKTPPFDLAQWRTQGVRPESLRVIAVKAAVAHRRAYDPIARASYTVDTPGPCSSNLRSFPFRHIHRPVYPLDDI